MPKENSDDRKVDREAEKSIISCMLQDQNTIHTVIGSLSSEGEEFYVENYQIIYNAIYQLTKKGESPNIIMVRDYLISKSGKESIFSMDYLTDIALFVSNPQEVNTFINIVKEKFIIRKIIESCNYINKECVSGDSNANEILDNAQQKFFKLSEKKGQKDLVNLSDIIPNVILKIANSAKSKDGITGIRTNYKQLDQWTSGFQDGNLIILAARPSVGKTTFALNLAYNIMEAGAKVAFFSLEMTKEEIAMKIISREAVISTEKLRSGMLSDQDWDKIYTATGNLLDNLFIDETAGITLAELRSKCRKKKNETGLDIIFIDYVQLMHAGKGDSDDKSKKFINNRQEEVAEISRSLKILAKELNIPIVALAQTKRPSDTSDKKDKRPQLEDLKESGSLEQDADLVMFIHRPKQDEGNTEETHLIVAKHRNGRIGTIKFHFDGATSKFEEKEEIEKGANLQNYSKKENE